jgi:hypothetical protein
MFTQMAHRSDPEGEQRGTPTDRRTAAHPVRGVGAECDGHEQCGGHASDRPEADTRRSCRGTDRARAWWVGCLRGRRAGGGCRTGRNRHGGSDGHVLRVEKTNSALLKVVLQDADLREKLGAPYGPEVSAALRNTDPPA